MGKTTRATAADGERQDRSPVSDVEELLKEAEEGLARADTSDPADCPYWRGRIEMAKDVLAVLREHRFEPEATGTGSGQPRQ